MAAIETGVPEVADRKDIKHPAPEMALVSPSTLPAIHLSLKRVTKPCEKGDQMNIYVGNLPIETTEDELRSAFMTFGEVIGVTIMNDKYIGSGQPRCYGYVEMTQKAEGITAITKLNGKTVKDRVVEVVEALPLSDKKSAAHINKNTNRSVKSRQRQYLII
jgi:RNA recognition motif-containing protein